MITYYITGKVIKRNYDKCLSWHYNLIFNVIREIFLQIPYRFGVCINWQLTWRAYFCRVYDIKVSPSRFSYYPATATTFSMNVIHLFSGHMHMHISIFTAMKYVLLFVAVSVFSRQWIKNFWLKCYISRQHLWGIILLTTDTTCYQVTFHLGH